MLASWEIIPQLAKAKNVYIVTDERAIVSAMQIVLPNLPLSLLISCWKYILMNVSIKVTELLIVSDNNQYVEDVRGLLKENS